MAMEKLLGEMMNNVREAGDRQSQALSRCPGHVRFNFLQGEVVIAIDYNMTLPQIQELLRKALCVSFVAQELKNNPANIESQAKFLLGEADV